MGKLNYKWVAVIGLEPVEAETYDAPRRRVSEGTG
jgi:hypothetical protein